MDDRPREKLLLHGPKHLSDAELLAILLRTGTEGISVMELAQTVLSQSGGLGAIVGKPVSSLTSFHGIGNDKAATVVAAFEIARRVQKRKRWLSGKKYTSPKMIAEYFIPELENELKEQFIVVCLNSANKIIRYEVISVGALDSSIVHPREVFKAAIESSAKSIILIHNHPSGSTDPSREDKAVTRKLIEGGKLLEINVIDHLIIAEGSYISFVEKGLI